MESLKNKSIMSILFILILLLIWGSVFHLTKDIGKAPVNPEYEKKAALQYLDKMTQFVRPIGTKGNEETRKFIKKTLKDEGIKVAELNSFVEHSEFGPPLDTGTPSNILATIKGKTDNSILIVGHYDSVPSSNGAGDNGIAVANMLQTAIEQSKEKTPNNNILFLFTDGEEIGLLGAKAFYENHFAEYNIQSVINLEGRGSSGIPFLFETTNQSIGIVKEYAHQSDFAVTSSFFSEAYKLLPFNSDFTVFKNDIQIGFNLAFIEGFGNYHNINDEFENIDHSTAFMQYSNLKLFINLLKDREMTLNEDVDQLSWTLFPGFVIFYGKWINLICIASILLFLGIVIYKNKSIKVLDVLMPIIVIGLTVGSGLLYIQVFKWFNQYLFDSWRLLPLNNDLFSISLGVFALLIVLIALYVLKVNKKTPVFSVGVLIVLFISSVVSHFIFPTLVLPIFLFAVPFFISDLLPGIRSIKRCLIFLAISLIPILFTVYTFRVIYIAVPKIAPVFIFIMPVLFVTYLLVNNRSNRSTISISALSALVILIILSIKVLLTTEFSSAEPRPSSLYLYRDINGGNYWMTDQTELDDWQKKIFNNSRNVKESMFFGVEETYKLSPIKESFSPSNLKVDGKTLSQTKLQLTISNNDYNALFLLIEDGDALDSITINETLIDKEKLSKSLLEDKILLRIWNTKDIHLEAKYESGAVNKNVRILGMNFDHMITTPKITQDNIMQAWPGYMTFVHLNNINWDKERGFNFEHTLEGWSWK